MTHYVNHLKSNYTIKWMTTCQFLSLKTRSLKTRSPVQLSTSGAPSNDKSVGHIKYCKLNFSTKLIMEIAQDCLHLCKSISIEKEDFSNSLLHSNIQNLPIFKMKIEYVIKKSQIQFQIKIIYTYIYFIAFIIIQISAFVCTKWNLILFKNIQKITRKNYRKISWIYTCPLYLYIWKRAKFVNFP